MQSFTIPSFTAMLFMLLISHNIHIFIYCSYLRFDIIITFIPSFFSFFCLFFYIDLVLNHQQLILVKTSFIIFSSFLFYILLTIYFNLLCACFFQFFFILFFLNFFGCFIFALFTLFFDFFFFFNFCSFVGLIIFVCYL